jgi:hypothetical protein
MVRDRKRGGERDRWEWEGEGDGGAVRYGMNGASFSHSAYSVYVSPGRHGPKFLAVSTSHWQHCTVDWRPKKDVVMIIMGDLDPDPRRS